MPLLYPTACEKSRAFWRVYTLLTIFLCEEVVRRGGGVLRGLRFGLGCFYWLHQWGISDCFCGGYKELCFALVFCSLTEGLNSSRLCRFYYSPRGVKLTHRAGALSEYGINKRESQKQATPPIPVHEQVAGTSPGTIPAPGRCINRNDLYGFISWRAMAKRQKTGA